MSAPEIPAPICVVCGGMGFRPFILATFRRVVWLACSECGCSGRMRADE